MKRISKRLKILFVLLLWPGVVMARIPSEEVLPNPIDWSAWETWSYTGRLRVQANLALYQKPSSLAGETQFDWGSLGFANLWQNDQEPFEVAISGQVGPERDPNSKQPSWRWDELRLSWKHKPELSLGVLIDPVIHFDDREWQNQVWGFDFQSGIERFGLIPASDLGLQLRSKTPAGDVAVQVSHGVGFPAAETGPRKDAQMVWEPTLPTALGVLKTQFFYRIGQHEHISTPIEKTRAGLQLVLQNETWSLGTAGTEFSDPVDGITGLLGEGVDLTAKGGQLNRGRLLGAWWRYRWGADSQKPYRISLRAEHLKTDHTDSSKDVVSQVLTLGKTLSSGMQIQVAALQTSFGKNHSIAAADRQRWLLSLSWGLEKKP